jgi:hypothetical protein
MNKALLLILSFFILTTGSSCSEEYPESFKSGTFKTTTEMNTVKFLYRNFEYQYVYSESHLGGNKLAKITWEKAGYKLETINKTSKFDSLVQTVILDKYIGDSTITETTYTDGIGLTFTTKWTKINKSANPKLSQILKENGIN